MILRMIARRYQHGVDLILPLLLAPFFTFHYGMFCMGHGAFVFALFGRDQNLSDGLISVLDHIWPVLQSNNLIWAAASLFILQLFDWIRDIHKHGLGFDSIKDLMTAPYRRIIVLHITIIASGFALGALDEPAAGLIILVALKTGFDIYHWQKDEQRENNINTKQLELSAEKIKQMQALFAEPEITVNGKKIRFNSFQELKSSKHMHMMMGVMRMMGTANESKLIEQFIDMKIAEENGDKLLEN